MNFLQHLDGRGDTIVPGILFPKAEATCIYCACASSLALLAARRERRREERRERETGLAKVGRERGLGRKRI